MSHGKVSGTNTYLTCSKYGKNHSGEYLAGKKGCFGCGQSSRRLRDFPTKNGQEGGKGRALDSKSKGSVSGTNTYPTCPKCGKNHPGVCLAGKEGCFGCCRLVTA